MVTTQYDPIGRMLSLTDQVGAVTAFQYDKRNLVQQSTDPLLQPTIFGYDKNGRLTSVRDRKNQIVNYTYTPTDKINTITYPDATVVSFVYDDHDRLASMTDTLGTTTYGYDGANRVTSYTNALGLNILYEYDAAGNVTKLTYPGNKAVTYTYDELNRLKTVTSWTGQVATYQYDDAGRLTKLINFNSSVVNYGYDNANRLTSLMNKKSTGTGIATYTFTLDSNGNRTKITRDEPIVPTVTTGITNFAYNAKKNRLQTAGANTFSFDNEGQLATKTAVPYGFDSEHRLTTIGSTTQFKYDGSDNRLKAIRSGVETRYLYDPSGNLLAELNSSNVVTKYYIYGAGLLAMYNVPTSKTYCYHFNALGSTIALTDSTQTVQNKYAYSPFGVLSQSEPIPQPFKYVGKYGVLAEANNLYYMRARYYDATVGRFISEDPIGFDGGQVNLYAYVANNPIAMIDPLGLCAESEKYSGMSNDDVFNFVLSFSGGGGKKINPQQVEKAMAKIGSIIKDHLTPSDVRGAIRDMLGNPVIKNGKTYNHLQEVEEALTGLRNNAAKLKDSTLIQAQKAYNDALQAISDTVEKMKGLGI